MKPETKEWLCTSTQERLNALQDELDRILSAKKDITKLAEFDLDALVHLLSPELESTFKNTPTPRSWSTKNLQNAGKLLLRRLFQVRHKIRGGSINCAWERVRLVS